MSSTRVDPQAFADRLPDRPLELREVVELAAALGAEDLISVGPGPSVIGFRFTVDGRTETYVFDPSTGWASTDTDPAELEREAGRGAP